MACMELPVASPWFARRRVDDSITLLWEPHVHRIQQCNIWHLRGRDRDLIVDTGLGIASLAPRPRTCSSTRCSRWRPTSTTTTPAASTSSTTGRSTEPRPTDAHHRGHRRHARHRRHPARHPRLHERGRVRDGRRAARRRDPRAGLRRDHLLGAGHRRRCCSTKATSSTSATAPSRCSTSPGTRPGASASGTWSPGSSSRATRSTTDRCSTRSPAPTSTRTSRTMERLPELPVEVVHAGHDPSFGRDRAAGAHARVPREAPPVARTDRSCGVATGRGSRRPGSGRLTRGRHRRRSRRRGRA